MTKIAVSQIEEIIKEAREKYNIPAVTVVVMDSDKILPPVHVGVRVDGSSNYVTDEDYFHLGSCSKSILVYMAGKMVEAGDIDWNTQFFDVFPTLKVDALQAYHEITLEDFFLCRAGIQAYTSGAELYPDLSGSDNKTLDFMKYLLQQTPSAAQTDSGKFQFLYSNASYAMASAMLEKISAMSYERLIDKYLKIELGLDVFIGWPNHISEDQPWGHLLDQDNTMVPFGPDFDYTLNPLINCAGNLSMRPRDFAKYVQLHLKGLSGRTEQLKSETYKYIDTYYDGFSLGVYNGKMLGKYYVGFDGSAGTFYARGFVLPQSDFGLAILINNGSGEAVEYMTSKLIKAILKGR